LKAWNLVPITAVSAVPFGVVVEPVPSVKIALSHYNFLYAVEVLVVDPLLAGT